MNKVRWALLGAVILFSASMQAQEVPLTLREALDAALRNNKKIILSGIDEEIARAKYRQTDAVFLPQVRLSYTGVSTNNPLNAFGFKLQQQSITSDDFNPEILNYPSALQNFMTKAEWQQPLINIDQVYARQAAQKQVEVYGFKTKRAKEYLTLEITNTYAQLYLAWQAMHVWEEATHTAGIIYVGTNNWFERGYLQKSDVLQVQVEQAMVATKLAEARSTIHNISNQLSLLMGTPGSAIYKADTLVQVYTAYDSTLRIPENRSDFLAMRAVIAASEKMIRSGKTSYTPQLNAFGEYVINDRRPFGFGSDSYLVGAQLSWTLFNGMSTRYKIAEQHAERNKAAEQLSDQQEQAQLALRKALRQLDDTRYTLQQQETAVQQAAESLRILQNRYQQGLVTTSELLQAVTLLSQQKLNQALAVFQYNTTVAYLQFLTSTSEK